MATERELNILIKARDMASAEINRFSDAFQTAGAGLVAAGVAGAAGIYTAVKAAGDFEAQLDAVAAVAGASESEMKQLEKTALDLGASSKFSAQEVAQGMEFMAANGFTAKETMAAMSGVLDAAAASGEDLGKTADMVSGALKGFQLKAEDSTKVADIMAKVANTSAAAMGDLGETFKYVAPIASAAGFSIEEISAAAGIMGNNMIKGSEAGTSLRGIINNLKAPTDAAAGMMQQLGINVRDADGSMKSMPDILAEFEKGLSGVDQATKDAAIQTIIGTEAQSGFQALLNAGSDSLRKYGEDLKNSGGSAAETAAAKMDNFNGAVEQMMGALDTAKIIIGQAFLPALTQVAGVVGEAISWFNGLDESTHNLAGKILIAFTVFSLLSGALLLLVPMLPLIGTLIASLLSPVSLVIFAVSALAAAFATNLGGIRDKTVEMLGAVKVQFDTVMIYLQSLVGSVWAQMQIIWIKYGDEIMAGVDKMWNTVKFIFESAANAIVAIIAFAYPYIQQIIKGVMEYVVPFLIQMFTKISTFLNQIMPPIVQLISWAWEKMIKPIIENTLNYIVPIVSTAWNLISGIFSGALDIIMGLIKFAVNFLTGNWGAALDGLKQAASGAWTLIKTVFQDGWEFVKSIFDGAIGWLKGQADVWLGAGEDMIKGLINGIKNMAGKVADAAKEAASDAFEAAKDVLGIKSPSRKFMEIGEYSGEGWIIGIESMIKQARGAAETLAGATVTPMENMSFDPLYDGSFKTGGSTQVILNFEKGSIVLPNVEDAEDFGSNFERVALAHIFKSM